MALPIGFLGKLKTLFPVLVVGGAVVITIKLLTQETPSNSQIIKVKAEEDIAETKHEEILEEEPEEPEIPPEQEAAPAETEEQAEEETEDNSDETNNGNQEESAQEKEPEKKEEKEDESKTKRSIITGNVVGDTLQKLFADD